MSEFLQKAQEFLSAAARKLHIIWTYIQAGFTWLMVQISDYIKEVIIPVMPTVTKLFNNSGVNKVVFTLLFTYIAVINIAAFIMYGVDKHRARTKKYRIRERTLFRVCFFGGGAGSMLGMLIFNHKTAKRKFSAWVPVMFAIQLLSGSFLFGFLGFWAFMR